MSLNHEVTIEAEDRHDGSLLSRIANILHDSRFQPEYFVWSVMSGSSEARVWMTLAVTEPELQEFIRRLRGLPDVRSVVALSPGAAILRSLAMPSIEIKSNNDARSTP